MGVGAGATGLEVATLFCTVRVVETPETEGAGGAEGVGDAGGEAGVEGSEAEEGAEDEAGDEGVDAGAWDVALPVSETVQPLGSPGYDPMLWVGAADRTVETQGYTLGRSLGVKGMGWPLAEEVIAGASP